MAGINGEDVPADGFSLFGLVEITIEFDFGEGLGMPALEMDLSWCSIEPPVRGPSVKLTIKVFLPAKLTELARRSRTA